MPLSGVQQAPSPAVLCGPADGEAHRRASLTDNGIRTVEAEFGECRSTVRIEGDLTFTEDFTGIDRLSTGARFTIEVRRPGQERRLEVRPGPSGTPVYSWAVDGRSASFGREEAEWLSEALTDLFRSSSYMARERAEWILRQSGPEGVLQEVERMSADYAQATYLGILLESGDLSPAEVRSVIELAGREIDSDHSLGQVLLAAAEGYSFDESTRTAFLEAATSVESDHTQGQLFLAALSRGDLSSEDLDLLLRTAAGSIESDHTVGQILGELASRYPLEPRLREPFLRAAATIESDHTAGQVYGIVLEQEGLTPALLAEVLDAALTIESDHTLGQLLEAAATHDLSQPELHVAFLRAAASIESDHTRASVYRRALALEGLTPEERAIILQAVGQIESDHEVSSLLVEIADGGLPGAALQRAFLDATATIESDHSRSLALSALIRVADLGEEEQITLLRVAGEVGSDNNLAEVLIQFAGAYAVEGRVRAAFLEALESVESEYYHGKVASAIVGE